MPVLLTRQDNGEIGEPDSQRELQQSSLSLSASSLFSRRTRRLGQR